MRNKKIDRLHAGIIIAFSTVSLIQDYFGLDGYVEYLQENWISSWYTIPIAIVLICVAICLMEERK